MKNLVHVTCGLLFYFGSYWLQAKPNIVIFYADDLGWGDIRANNTDPAYMRYTPNIDKLFSQGIRFDNYVTHDVCSPSRAGLLTGKHYAAVNEGPETGGELPPDVMTIGKDLQQNGYVTGCFGKWHNGSGNKPVNSKLVATTAEIIPDNDILEQAADNYYGINVMRGPRRAIPRTSSPTPPFNSSMRIKQNLFSAMCLNKPFIHRCKCCAMSCRSIAENLPPSWA